MSGWIYNRWLSGFKFNECESPKETTTCWGITSRVLYPVRLGMRQSILPKGLDLEWQILANRDHEKAPPWLLEEIDPPTSIRRS
jgi:hypothetical protein